MSKDLLKRKKRKNLKAGGLNPPADLSYAQAEEETAEVSITEETPADVTETTQTAPDDMMAGESAAEEDAGDGLDLVFAELFTEQSKADYEPPVPRFYRVGKKVTAVLLAVLLGLTAAYNLGYMEVIEAEIRSFTAEPARSVEVLPEETDLTPEAEPVKEPEQELLDALTFTDDDIFYRKTVVYLTCDGSTAEYLFDEQQVSVRTLLNAAGVTLADEDKVEPGLSRMLGDRDSATVTRIKHVEYTETVSIPASSEIKLTPLLRAGRQKELNQSSKRNGEKVLTYRDEYVNGVLTKHETVSEKVTRQPVPSLTLQGASVSMSAINGAKYTDIMIAGNAPTSYERLITGYCTAYNFKKGCWGASGMYLSQGFVAVDPEVIPYGSLLYITNSDGRFVYGWAIAADFCEAASWGWISADLFFDTYEESVLFGKHTMNIYIVKQLYRDELQPFVARQGYFDVRVPARPAPPPEPEEPEITEEPEATEETEVAEEPEQTEVQGETEVPQDTEQPAENGEPSSEDGDAQQTDG